MPVNTITVGCNPFRKEPIPYTTAVDHWLLIDNGVLSMLHYSDMRLYSGVIIEIVHRRQIQCN